MCKYRRLLVLINLIPLDHTAVHYAIPVLAVKKKGAGMNFLKALLNL